MSRTRFALLILCFLLTWSAAIDDANSQTRDLTETERQLAQTPDSSELLISAGRLYLDSGNHRKARELLDRAIAIDSTNAVALALLGQAAMVELQEGYDQKIAKNTDYRTNLIFAALEPMSKAVSLSPDNLEIRLMRGIASVYVPVFGGYMHRFNREKGVAETITTEMIENGYGGYLDYAVEDLHTVISGNSSDEMKAQAYFYLGLAYRIKGLQYWQTLTKEYPESDASGRAWGEMGPKERLIVSLTGGRPLVLVSFNIGLETDLPPQTAVWIEDAQGNFVKSLYVSGFSANVKENQVVLPEWAGASEFQVDAVTSASISAGQHTYEWDLTTTNGNQVQDGKYVVKIEVHHWPSMHYQLVSAEIKVGTTERTTVVHEGNLVQFVEVRFIP